MNPDAAKHLEPAFPMKEPLTTDYAGMSLRDYFAAKVLQSMLANTEILNLSDQVIDAANIGRAEWMSQQAYLFADAMLVERAK